MREPGADPVDRLLEAAGERWRAGQPSPAPVGAALFAAERHSGTSGWFAPDRAWSFVAGAGVAVAIIAALAVAAPSLLPRLGPGAPAAPGPSAEAVPDGYLQTGLDHCPVTRPDGSFTPPAQPGADWDADISGVWYGSAGLWTMLDRDGPVWVDLPRSAIGLTQKTFWWSFAYRGGQDEPRPEIFVTGSRLDRPGRFGFGPGTNASFGLGSAMLVGVEFPSEGCWNITAHYRGAELTYVAWIDAAD